MGKSRAAAFALGIQDIDEGAYINAFAENGDSDSFENPESNFYASLMFHRILQSIFIWHVRGS